MSAQLDIPAIFIGREEVTLFLAIFGSALGVYNAWKSHLKDKVRLRITPVNVVDVRGKFDFGIEIKNLSSFDITVHEVGFELPGTGRKLVMPFVSTSSGDMLPVRMIARTSITTYFPKRNLLEYRDKTLGNAYAKTACGKTFFGSSLALDQLKNEIRTG